MNEDNIKKNGNADENNEILNVKIKFDSIIAIDKPIFIEFTLERLNSYWKAESLTDVYLMYDFDKFNTKDRDSVDTLELIRDSAELGINDSSNFNRKNQTFKEYSNVSSFSQSIEENELYEQQNEAIVTENASSPSIGSSLNLESKLKPLSLFEAILPEKSEETFTNDDEIDTSDLEHLEPKLRDAWIKMRKLDKILERVTKKEKTVKRETLCLIEKNRADLEILRLTSDHKESKQEAENTAHFLALSYFDLDDEIERDEAISTHSEPATPVFKTQVPYYMDDIDSARDEKTDSQSNFKKTESTASNIKAKKQNGKTQEAKLKTGNKQDQNEKDFIKRNIQLAQDKGGTLAMTEEEKNRLNELMLELEDTDEKKNKNSLIREGNESTYLVEYNPNDVVLAEGDGFTPDKSDRLKEIDSKLERINLSRIHSDSQSTISNRYRDRSLFSTLNKMSKASLDSINNVDTESYLSGTKQIQLNDEFDENDFGDHFIREARLTREQETRLKLIDSQLEKLRSNSELTTDSIKKSESSVELITETQLKLLLEEYSNEINENSAYLQNQKLDILKEEDDDKLIEFSQNGFNDDRLSILPVLSENLIKSLLEQAKSEGIFVTEEYKSESPIHSFYEEAIEIVNSYSNINLNLDQEEVEEADLQENRIEPLNNFETLKKNSNQQISLKSNNFIESRPLLDSPPSTFFEENNQQHAKNSKLPALVNKIDKDELSDTALSQDDIRSSSSMSNLSSSTSSSILPRISSRYLPK